MTKLYLITGFLGAGKTTFLHSFTKKFPDKKIALIINEFGKTGVDGTILKDLKVELTEINNGSIFCSCRVEQFESAVQTIIETKNPDMIFVEASGLADPSAVRSIFCQGIFDGVLEYAGAICIIDAVRFHKIYQTAKVCRMQLAVSDMVLINKTDIADSEQIESIVSVAKTQRDDRPVHETVYGDFNPEWLNEIKIDRDLTGGDIHTKDINLKKMILDVKGFDEKNMIAFLKMFAEETYRIKGFVELDGKLSLIDCVGPIVNVTSFDGDVEKEDINKIVVLYGHGLKAKKGVSDAASWFKDCEINITFGA